MPEAGAPPQPQLCPYLGLSYDPSVVARYPTADHTCVSPKQRQRPTLEHQTAFCLTTRHTACPFYSAHNAQEAHPPQPRARRRLLRLIGLGSLTLLVAALVILAALRPRAERALLPLTTPVLAAQPPATEPVPSTAPAAIVPLPTVTPSPPAAEGDMPVAQRFATPTPEPGGTVHTLMPKSDQVGWWISDPSGYRQIGDSFLYAGQYNGQTYVAALRFDLTRVARGAPIRAATLRLTGLRREGLDPATPNRWLIQLIAERDLPELATADFLTVFTAPAAITLLPELTPAQLDVGLVNEWRLDEVTCRWLEQQLVNGAGTVSVRMLASSAGDNALFAWDSGLGSESRGAAPALILSVGPPPATPPPLPTRPILIATLTPLPANVLTAVAQSATATAEATHLGTATPLPYDIVTPTPFPENLATVQAIAASAGLPAVVLNTPVPANGATATVVAAYATAVALTTGTFTPVPTGYVTPVLLYPSPPAENVATAAARVVAATAQAGLPTPTVPWNGVYAVYVYATSTPANMATAVAMVLEQNAAALATGAPTPTPWNLVVITPVPPPTPTPIPLVIPADQLAATPTPSPTIAVGAQDLAQFRGQILFLSNRTGATETWVMDPESGAILALVRDPRLHALARELYLAPSPDGNERAIVQEDSHRDLQIKVYSNLYGTTRELTHFSGATSYDPAWSPRGDWIVFVSTANDGDELYRIDPQGVTLQRLTFNAWEWDKHPSWSPDGNRIVFFSNRGTGRRQIWMMNADGSDQRNLSNDEFENWDPIWIR